MAKKGSSAPPAPDPNQLVQAQAEANRINQITPFGQIYFGRFNGSPAGSPQAVPAAPAAGSRVLDFGLPSEFWSPDHFRHQSENPNAQGLVRIGGDAPPTFQGGGGNIPGLPEGFSPTSQETQVVQFSPEVQALLDAQIGAATGLGEEARRRVDLLPGAFTPTDFSADRRRVEDAIFSRARGLLDPVFEQNEERLRERLANAGQLGNQFINPGGRQDLDIFSRNKNKTFSDLALDAIIRGGAEQSRLSAEERADRVVPFNELAALLSGSQINVPLPNTQIPLLDVMGPAGLQQSAANQAAADDAASQRGMFGGLFGLGAAALRNPVVTKGLFG